MADWTPLGFSHIEEARALTATGWAIDTQRLVKRFPHTRGWRGLLGHGGVSIALDQVSLKIPRGEIFGLLGPNGAGKTTLIKILSTLLIPTEGKARVAGLDVVEDSASVRKQIGVVYGDERTFSWRLSALENLKFYAALYGMTARDARKRILSLLDRVGLANEMHMPMHHFSSGMKQRAAVARGLLPDPRVLLMDEPTKSLDPLSALELRNLIQDLVADGDRTVLLATHLMSEAETLCDRVALLHRGQIRSVGSMQALQDLYLTDERHQVRVSELEVSDLATLRTIPGVRVLEVESESGPLQQLRVTVAAGSKAMPLLIRELASRGGMVWSSTRETLSLEEIFAIGLDGKTHSSAESQSEA